MSIGKFIGKGNTAEVFELDENYVIKLFYDTMPSEYIEREFEISKYINELGIPSPKTSKLMAVNNRTGIIYEKVIGKNFTQMLSSQPFFVKKHACQFAEWQASFHEKNAENLPSQKDYFASNIDRTNLLSREEKVSVLKKLQSLPEGEKVCHGDYHSDNIILHNGEVKILDWMTCTSGNPSADVARTFIIMKYSFLSAEMPKTMKIFIQLIRNVFTRAYLNSYMMQTNISKESIQEWLLPVMAARLTEGIPDGEKQFLINKIRNALSNF